MILSAAGCGPAPLDLHGPERRSDPARPDAQEPLPPETAADAGPWSDSDARATREQLPPPDARGAEDASADDTISGDAGAPSPRPPAAGEVVIVEALANPGGTDTGREWIEIANRSAEPLALADLHLADASGDVAVPAGILVPGGRVVLGQSVDPGRNGGAPVAVAYGTRLALNNDAEEISLCLGTCADGTVIDRAGWKALGGAYDGHALVFDRDANRTCAATAPFGTAGDFGTPSAPDDGCADPDAGF